MYRSLSAWRPLLLLALLAPATGCGGKVASISGTVNLDGAPVESGFVTFTPIDGTPGSGGRSQIVKGAYTIGSDAGAAPGTYRVEVSARRKTGKKVPVHGLGPSGSMAEEEVEAVPARYNKASTLRETLKAGANTVNFELSSKAKP